MMRPNWKRLLSVLLAVCVCMSLTAPVSVAAPRGGAGGHFTSIWDRGHSSFWDWLFGRRDDQDTSKPEQEPDPKPSRPSGGTSSAKDDGVALTLVEDATTVQAGTALRASTYAVQAADGTTTGTVKYFPVTLYNYDERYNSAMHQMEVDAAAAAGTTLTKWNGIYFGGNGHGANVLSSEAYVYGDDYTKVNTVYCSDMATEDGTGLSTDYYTKINGVYYSVTVNRSTGYYGHYEYYSYYYYANDTLIGSNSTVWNPASQSVSLNNGHSLYKKGTSTGKLSYANYNKWTGHLSGTGSNGNRTYSGLVESRLINSSIRFNYSEAGLFTADTSNKDVYTNVQLPFEYKDGYYTFDANTKGAYFHEDADQGTSATPASNSKLYYSETPQKHNFDGADGRKNGWFPFNDTGANEEADRLTTDSTGTADYFFGMQANIPFSMTANGMTSSTSNDHIKFEFSGDDDVWVFIDDTLVLDIGGIHNGMNGTIDFAENKWSISEMTKISGQTSADINGKALSGTVFNDGTTQGVLNIDRESFAAKSNHTLTVYYLERGAGSSNCMIKFNLPMNDTLTVQKVVPEKDNEGSAIAADTMTDINNKNFGFTLYKDGASVANATYALYDKDGSYLSTATTDANGHFQLKNGQKASFIGSIDADDGNSYYVVEDAPGDGWASSTWSYEANIAGTTTETETAAAWTSPTVKVIGSDEAVDSLAFTCTNVWQHVNETTIKANDDQIVLDYGLPVEIDVLKNDIAANAKEKSIQSIDNEDSLKYGTAKIEGGKIVYTLTKQLTGVEVLKYTAMATGNTATDTATATAKVYIIPATTMYYEEDFGGTETKLVNYTVGEWKSEETANSNPYQEPGVVGTTTDSPYGSDVAYLDDSGDSNGTSKYVDTTQKAAQFSYTFTGTGTSFFARTTNNSGYMKVVIKQDGERVYQHLRDTSYKTDDKSTTLYNIPVFTWTSDDYGTYEVTVSIAGGTNGVKAGWGTDFWLDGIKVFAPLAPDDKNASVAERAYSTDGEANMTFVTLREKLLSTTEPGKNGEPTWPEEGSFVLFTDTDGEIVTAQEYQSIGPKEEVYLAKGQSVSFALKDWDPNRNKLYLGIKAPMGSGTVEVGNESLTIENTVDCYYSLTASCLSITTDANGSSIVTVTITNTGDNVISLTNIKVTGNAKFAIVPGTDISGEDVEAPDVAGEEGGDAS